jgi:hypothetical protein
MRIPCLIFSVPIGLVPIHSGRHLPKKCYCVCSNGILKSMCAIPCDVRQSFAGIPHLHTPRSCRMKSHRIA